MGGGGGRGLELVCGRPALALDSAFGLPDKTTTNNNNKTNKTQTSTKLTKHKQKAKRAAGIEGQMATMLKSHTRQIDTIDTTAMKRARKK